MWVEFVVGSCPYSMVFLQVLWFSSLHKHQHFQTPIRSEDSGSKSHLLNSTEMPIYFILFICIHFVL